MAMKRDPRLLTQGAEALLPKLDNPRHRLIIQNYRLHALLEVAGRWSEIFTPEMTVDRPLYRLDGATRVEGDEVVAMYKGLVDNGTSIMILDPETLIVGDWGFSSEALFHTYLPGTAARSRGHAEADPAKTYVVSHWICMMWPYDERGRMIGEHTYSGDEVSFRECPESEFIGLDEVRALYAPLIEDAKRDLAIARREAAIAA
jgi:hypothetical protein